MKILIAEDDTTTRLVLGATLKKFGHEVTAVSDGKQAWDALQKGHFPLLISDWMMPGINGLELCRLVRSGEPAQYTYIILLTTLGGKASYLDGMDAGADDFITKPFDQDQLAARLRVAERILALHERLRQQAVIDGLTGLLNRSAIMNTLSKEMERSKRQGQSLGIILLDLDHFKQVNDIHGHATGDIVLKETARRMRDSLREYDQVGRYGGEEFLIVTPGCNEREVQIIAERVRANIGKHPVPIPGGGLNTSCSLGVAVTQNAPLETPDSLIARADAALYCAKAKGRNRVEFAETVDASSAC